MNSSQGLHQYAVRLRHDPMLLLPFHEWCLPCVHVRVEQNLVRGGLDLGFVEKRVEVLDLEVADTDTPTKGVANS